MPTAVKPVLYWCSVYYVLGRARALLFTLALSVTTRLLLLLLRRAVAQSGHNIRYVYIFLVLVSAILSHTMYTSCRCVWVLYIYIYNILCTTRMRRTDHAASCNTIWRTGPSPSAAAVSLARGLRLYPSILGSVRRRSSCRQTVYRPTDRPTDARLYTCRRPSATAAVTTTTTRARFWETYYYYVCVYIYIILRYPRDLLSTKKIEFLYNIPKRNNTI